MAQAQTARLADTANRLVNDQYYISPELLMKYLIIINRRAMTDATWCVSAPFAINTDDKIQFVIIKFVLLILSTYQTISW